MFYREIIVETTHEGADFVTDAFFSLGVNGVSVRDPADVAQALQQKNTWDYVDEGLLQQDDGPVYVSAFVAADETEQKIALLNEALDNWANVVDLGTRRVQTREYQDADWRQEWKKYYHPIPAGAFTVVPEWISTQGVEGIPIRIDPGMAFGTGEHESTRMCLILLSALSVNGKRVLDVGTGSGILGIGAAEKGANEVDMVDLDSLSVQAARHNAALNGVQERTHVWEGDLGTHAKGPYDLVLANLTADILMRLAPDLPRLMGQDGVLIASGIIHSRLQDVTEALERVGLTLEKQIALGEWDALQARRS